jgi:homoserine dehydrogenase
MTSSQPKRSVRIALLGCGTVGGGVADLLLSQGSAIEELGGAPYELVAIAIRTAKKHRSPKIPQHLFCDAADALIQDPSIDLIVECIGGIAAGRRYVEAALRQGKHVVTANKDLLAMHGPELRALAASRGLSLAYEAAVGGAIPIVRTIIGSLAGERIIEVGGVLNGTTNFILGEMFAGATYGAALAEAQRRGFAEADPTSDVAGIDAAHKLAILSQLAFRRAVTTPSIQRRGIEHIVPDDITLARRLSFSLKLIACARMARPDAPLAAAVTPAYVSREHPFAHPTGAQNCIRVVGRAAGSLTFAGTGAGRDPTASAVVGDIIAVLHGIFSHHTASLSLAPMVKIDIDAFTLARLVRLGDGSDARVAASALRDAGIPAISLEVPALRTGSLPLSHDAKIVSALSAARIEIGSIVPIWEDADDPTQTEEESGPPQLHATTLT